MPTPPVPEAEPQSETALPETSKPAQPASLHHGITALVAIGLLIAFFLPWIGSGKLAMSGMDIQRNFSSYRLVCVMPLLAVVVAVLKMSELPARSMAQLAGCSPFVIYLYATYRLDANIFEFAKALRYGAWVALACGAILLFVPPAPKKRKG